MNDHRRSTGGGAGEPPPPIPAVNGHGAGSQSPDPFSSAGGLPRTPMTPSDAGHFGRRLLYTQEFPLPGAPHPVASGVPPHGRDHAGGGASGRPRPTAASAAADSAASSAADDYKHLYL